MGRRGYRGTRGKFGGDVNVQYLDFMGVVYKSGSLCVDTSKLLFKRSIT